MRSESGWRGAASAVVVALGVAVAWAFVGFWVVSLYETNAFQGRTIERLVVRSDGPPVISAQRQGAWGSVEYCSLDREPLDLKLVSPLSPSQFPRPYEPSGLLDVPPDWSLRVGGVASSAEPSCAWYLVRDDQRPGLAYVVAYDYATKRPVAYASRSGVLPTRPEPSDWFRVGNHFLSYGANGIFVSAGVAYLQPGSYAPFRIQSIVRMLYVIDGARIIEIDTEKRKTRLVGEVAGLQSLSMMARASVSDQHVHAIPDVLVARGASEIAVFEHNSDLVTRFPLPRSLVNEQLYVYLLSADRLLIQTFGPDGSTNNVQDLTWLDNQGNVVEERTVRIATYVQTSPRTSAWVASGVAPSPVGWLLGWIVGGPLGMVQQNQSSTYGEALARTTWIVWPAMTAVLLLGAGLALLAWRKHHAMSRSNTALWTLCVFLLGPAGLIAYALHWRQVASDDCPTCGKRTPRDREHCPKCLTEWPAPERLGIEVYA